MVQTSISSAPEAGLPGMQDGLDRWHDVISCVVSQTSSPAGIEPGLFVVRALEGDRSARVPVAVPAANADAFMLATATSASQQIFGTGGTAFDGDGGTDDGGASSTGRISPPRKVTITRSSHADHDAVTIVVAGFDENGAVVSESIAATNGGNETLTTSAYFSMLTSVTIPAQAGTGGTTSVGLSASFTFGGEALGVSLRAHKALNADQSLSNNEVHSDEATMPVIRRGYVWVDCETSCKAGDRAYVRAIATGSEKRGAFRARSTDSGDAVAVEGLRFMGTLTAAGRVLLEVALR